MDFFEVSHFFEDLRLQFHGEENALSGWPPQLGFSVCWSNSQPLSADGTWLLAGNILGQTSFWASHTWQFPWGLPVQSMPLDPAVGSISLPGDK